MAPLYLFSATGNGNTAFPNDPQLNPANKLTIHSVTVKAKNAKACYLTVTKNFLQSSLQPSYLDIINKNAFNRV